MEKTKRIKNEGLINTIEFLREKGRENEALIWRNLADRLASSNKNRHEVNVSRIGRHTKENETIAVPGKILGSGKIGHCVVVASLSISAAAKEKIEKAGGSYMSLRELFEKNPKGTNIRIMG